MWMLNFPDKINKNNTISGDILIAQEYNYILLTVKISIDFSQRHCKV